MLDGRNEQAISVSLSLPDSFFSDDEQIIIGYNAVSFPPLLTIPVRQAHFKHLVASCASLHSSPQTLAPHFRHLIVPQ